MMRCLLKASQFLCLVLFFLNFQTNLSLSSSLTHLRSHDEASALIQLKSSFSIDKTYSYRCRCDHEGYKYYPKTDSWKEGTDCCSWDGVTCDGTKGHVIGLDLSCSWLYGTIPSNSSLFHLKHLQKLNLALNNFNNSRMSSKFGEFASLVSLNLSDSYFAGQVPSQVSLLSKLVSLDLSSNYDQTLDRHTLKGLVHNLTEVRELFLGEINMSSTDLNVFMNLSSSLTSLSLFGCDLRGKFPENIFHLPNLKMLSLGYNVNLSLNIPKFNQTSHLEILDLSSLSLFGDFFDSIGNLVSLEHLDVSYAIFPTRRFLESIWNLVSLKSLNLRETQMSVMIPRALGNLSKLNDLDLAGNYLSGQIPSYLANLTQLEFLYLSRNQLEGSIPDEVSAFPNLISLDLSYNLLQGTLPSWLFTLSSLKYIFLGHNQFSGHIEEFQHTSLEAIHLGDNKLQGSMPSSISQLLNLTYLSLFSNSLSGVIEFDMFSALQNLQVFDLSSNNLSGVVEFGIFLKLQNLEVLDLSSNHLSGIGEFGMFSKLQNLQWLDLSSNSLSLYSNSTSADYTLPNLEYLDLSSCNVSEFPKFLRGSKNLLCLGLSNNRISGKIPEWMQDVGKDSLCYLNLSHNSLTNIGQFSWKKMLGLDLSSNLINGYLPIPPLTTYFFSTSNNSLSGNISSLICEVSSLRVLDLSQNNLSGTIPRCFGNLSRSVWMLVLRMNKFHGIIPPTFTKGCQLKNLDLSANSLEGPLTRSIMNCKDLEVLDLGKNKINGTFPHWLGNLPELQVLVLQSNQLQGSIQDTRSNLSFSKIQIFDLSNNSFTGMLPVRYIRNFIAMINLTKDESANKYLGMSDRPRGFFYIYSIGNVMIKGLEMELVKIFTKLTSIDLSNNKFSGEIPEVIGKLNSLKGLNLSHNNLSGCIPTSIGNLINLEWLDLSSNYLVGKIPERLTDLTFLSVFNVSENQLHGHIPQGKQFDTFKADSYEGNIGLCGFPVSRSCYNSEPPPPSILLEEDRSKSNIAFGWKVVLIGYGCGLIFGLVIGYIVFQVGKPKWFVRWVEDRHHK